MNVNVNVNRAYLALAEQPPLQELYVRRVAGEHVRVDVVLLAA